MNKTILLFDMDGVLIHSRGYYFSLQSVIKLLGRNLDLENAELGMDEISKLEAIGVFHIWDHLTIFSSLLMLHIWKVNRKAKIPKLLVSAPSRICDIPKIDFREFTQTIKSDHIYSSTDIRDFILAHGNQLDSDQRSYIDFMLDSSREIYRSPVLPLMQEFILGSQLFQQTYGLDSQLGLKSYPQQYDKPALSDDNYGLLQKWLKSKDHHGAIFTSRPNLPPDKDFFGTPEAEIGSKIIGLENLPIIGAGSLDWLADKEHTPLRGYNKPNPVHVLAAIQAAIGQTIEFALNTAVKLINQEHFLQIKDEWQDLNHARIYVFEDSTGGLISAQKAGQLLVDTGIPNKMHLIGIGEQSDKIRSLLTISDQVYSDINSCPLIDIIAG